MNLFQLGCFAVPVKMYPVPKECPTGMLKNLVFPELTNHILYGDYSKFHALAGSLFKLLSFLTSKSEWSVKNPVHFLRLLKSVNLQSLRYSHQL
jgi:hypothetical protein